MLEFLLGACFFLCIFAPFTFVIFLIDAIKKVVSGDGNEYFPGLGAGLSLFIMLGGIFYVLYECKISTLDTRVLKFTDRSNK